MTSRRPWRGYALLAAIVVLVFAGGLTLRSPLARRGFNPRDELFCPEMIRCEFADTVGRLGVDDRVSIDPSSRTWLGVVTTLPDGSILLGGRFGVLKLRPDGSIDRRFGRRGVASLDEGGVKAMAVDGRGRIVVTGFRFVGWTPGRPSEWQNGGFGVARLLPSGRLDRTFGRRGEVVIDFTPEQESPCCVWVDDRDRVIVAGELSSPGYNPVILRFTESGRRDSAFGKAGVVQLDMVFGQVLRDAAGGFTVAGSPPRDPRDPNPPQSPSEIKRLTPDGAIERSFGDGGRVGVLNRDDSGEGLTRITDQRLDSRGRIVGLRHERGGSAYLQRFLPDGSLDRAFGDQGNIALPGTPSEYELRFAIDTSDRVIVAGIENRKTREPYGEDRLWLRRY